MIRRALSDCLAARQFGKKEIADILTFFGSDPPECVYCGSQDVKRWDHLVPINKGGETLPGNMVPACAGCDDSKRAEPFEKWMLSNAERSPLSPGSADVAERIEHIKAYVRHFDYTARTLEERLNKPERERLMDIHSRLKELQKDIDALISDYRARTGNK